MLSSIVQPKTAVCINGVEVNCTNSRKMKMRGNRIEKIKEMRYNYYNLQEFILIKSGVCRVDRRRETEL